MSLSKAETLIEDDDDYNDEGILKSSAREKYEEKYDDIDYLSINANEDNDFDPDLEVDEDEGWD